MPAQPTSSRPQVLHPNATRAGESPTDTGSHTLTISPPAGRAFLAWQDKQTPTHIDVPVLSCAEAFLPDDDTPLKAGPQAEPNRLYHCDNQHALAHLLAHGMQAQFRLIYIDPPFDSGLVYSGKVRTRGPTRQQLGLREHYRDIWPGDTYLQFMYERLLLLRDLLAPDGVIWLHCDYRQSHRLQLILEEVFGAENYLNTIAWRSQVPRGAKVNAFYFPNSTHFLHVFAKDRSAQPVWNPPRKRLTFTRRQAAAQFMEDEQGFFRTSDPGTYSFERLQELHAAGRLYAPFNGEIRIDPARRTVECTNGGNIGVKYYLQAEGKNRFSVERAVDNLWDDIPGLGTTPGEDVGYPTQKTEALLERIIATSSNPGDWILDCFAGSGTTAAVAQRMGRRWVACDVGHGAIQSNRRRQYLQHLADPAAMHAAMHAEPHAGQHGQFPGFVVYRLPEALPKRETPGPPRESRKARGRPPKARDNLPASRKIAVYPALRENCLHLLPGEAMSEQAGHIPRSEVDSGELPSNSFAASPADTPLDWRAWIDLVEIDPDYDGQIFRPRHIDVPVERRDLVAGEYTLDPRHMGTKIAVRITQVTGYAELFVCLPTE